MKIGKSPGAYIWATSLACGAVKKRCLKLEWLQPASEGCPLQTSTVACMCLLYPCPAYSTGKFYRKKKKRGLLSYFHSHCDMASHARHRTGDILLLMAELSLLVAYFLTTEVQGHKPSSQTRTWKGKILVSKGRSQFKHQS